MLFCFIIFFLNSDIVTKSTYNALVLCFSKLIPSIFPFMILSSIFLQAGLIKGLLRKKELYFGIDKSILEIILISWISGFLIGPRFLNSVNTEEDLTNYYILTSNAGVGFVISFIGNALWNSVTFGVYLYFVQILSSIIIFKLSKNKVNVYYGKELNKTPLLTSVSNSIKSGTKVMVEICGFTVFFSIIRNLLTTLTKINSNKLTATISSIMEITSGATTAINIENHVTCAFFTGFAAGFGGLCMCLQVFSLCNNKISYKRFIIIKFFHGVICGIFSSAFVIVFNIEPMKSVSSTLNNEFNATSIIVSAVFMFFVMHSTKKFLKSK